jgi:hypothetical protein
VVAEEASDDAEAEDLVADTALVLAEHASVLTVDIRNLISEVFPVIPENVQSVGR